MPQGQHLTSAGEGPPPDAHPPYFSYPGPPVTPGHDPAIPAQPAYQYADPYAYPNPSPYGYPAVQLGERRPGTVTAAAVLGYVSAGLLVIAAMIVFTGASLIAGIEGTADAGVNRYTIELTFDGFVNLIAAGLLIAGGVLMTTRRPAGRTMYSIGAGIVLVEAVYWLGRWGSLVQDVGGMAFYAILFTALAVIGLTLAWTRDCTRWLTGSPPRPYGG